MKGEPHLGEPRSGRSRECTRIAVQLDAWVTSTGPEVWSVSYDVAQEELWEVCEQ
jgi:hypothetical protein